MNKNVKKQLLHNKQAANRGRKMIRSQTKLSVKRTEVYRVWDAYLEWFYGELIAGREVKGMANVGSFMIQKNPVPENVMKLRAKGLSVRNGFFIPIKRINKNNLDYICRVVYKNGKSVTEGVKFHPCKKLREKIFESVSAGKDYINVSK
jgi:hypothetical protein